MSKVFCFSQKNKTCENFLPENFLRKKKHRLRTLHVTSKKTRDMEQETKVIETGNMPGTISLRTLNRYRPACRFNPYRRVNSMTIPQHEVKLEAGQEQRHFNPDAAALDADKDKDQRNIDPRAAVDRDKEQRDGDPEEEVPDGSEEEEIEVKWRSLRQQYFITLETTVGCGARGDYFVGAAWEEMNRFATKHPEYKPKLPKKRITSDDGYFGSLNAMSAVGFSLAHIEYKWIHFINDHRAR
jgi:hypothetical protein